MDVYLLERENLPTYAVLAEDAEEAKCNLSSEVGFTFDEKGTKVLGDHGYTARKFIEGQDGKILEKMLISTRISYPLAFTEQYIIVSEPATELT